MCRFIKTALLLAGIATNIVLADNKETDIKLVPKAPESIVTRKAKKGLSLKESKVLTLKRKNIELGISGRIKIDYFVQKNANMLNKNLPDELEFFKERLSLMFDGSYGLEKYGYKAIQLYAELRHKGVWGKALSYADKDAGLIGPSAVRFNQQDETLFGSHSHTSGKTLIWFNEAWLQFSPNAAIGNGESDFLHFLKLGWFEFSLGRGIALGGMYGTNKEIMGLYSYPEEKGAPGIDLHGTVIKDILSYDLYYAKFQERNKSFADCINLDKQYIVGLALPFRGESKDNDLVAMRLQWTPLAGRDLGNLELEPYIFYNAASDQRVERPADANFKWGSYGLSAEYAYNAFEIGGETAFNYGREKMYAIDRNRSVNYNKEGVWGSQYTAIYSDPLKKVNATRTTAAVNASQYPATNGQQIMNPDTGAGTGFYSGDNRFRPQYFNRMRGWMGVVDCAYTMKDWNLKFAVSYGYASGDANPYDNPEDKSYKAFVGLHEGYFGKRVKAVFLLDERLLLRPVVIEVNGSAVAKATTEMVFSDLHLLGVGVTWTPKCGVKELSFNPNIVGFWNAYAINKFIADPTDLVNGGKVSDEKARKYMGTEINLLSKCLLLKDLYLYANLAVFIPGEFFTDVKGVPLNNHDEIFRTIINDPRNNEEDISKFRLGTDTAYHVNIGFDYKF